MTTLSEQIISQLLSSPVFEEESASQHISLPAVHDSVREKIQNNVREILSKYQLSSDSQRRAANANTTVREVVEEIIELSYPLDHSQFDEECRKERSDALDDLRTSQFAQQLRQKLIERNRPFPAINMGVHYHFLFSSNAALGTDQLSQHDELFGLNVNQC